MISLRDIIELCNQEQGKVFVMDEKGDIKLVILGIDAYKAIQRGGRPVIKVSDPEIVNRKIIKAQLEEELRGEPSLNRLEGSPLHRVVPPTRTPRVTDMREEVIDPSFDFDAPDDL